MHKLGWEFVRYVFASAIALAVDMGILLLLAEHIHYIAAATVSFLIGSVIHYLLAVKLVFRNRRLADQASAERIIFIAAGLGGLMANAAIIYLCIEWLGTQLPVAKIAAAGCSFVIGFVSRKLILFRSAAGAQAGMPTR